jgi:hypothetical protein
MHVATQFSIFLINKPGILAQTLNALGAEKINIVAMTMMDSVEHGVLRLVAAQTELARNVLAKLNVPANETDVLCVDLPNRAGAVAAVATHLAQAHININYAYVTSGGRGGRTTAVFKVADINKAIKILEKTFATKTNSDKGAKKHPPANRH